MGLFSNNVSGLRKGDKVKIKYMGVEGIIVDIDNSIYSVSYMTESDREVIEGFTSNELEKC